MREGRRGRRREGSTRITNGAVEGNRDKASFCGELEAGLAPLGADPGKLRYGGGQPGRQILGLHLGCRE